MMHVVSEKEKAKREHFTHKKIYQNLLIEKSGKLSNFIFKKSTGIILSLGPQ